MSRVRQPVPVDRTPAGPVAGDLARVWVTVSLAVVTVLGIGSIAVIGIGRLAALEAAAERAETATAVTVSLRQVNLAIQDERTAAERWIGVRSTSTRQDYLAGQERTDRALGDLRRDWLAHAAVIGTDDTPSLADIMQSEDRLPALRESILAGEEESSIAGYAGIIDVTLSAARRMEALASESVVAPRVRVLARIMDAGHAVAQQRDVVYEALAAGRPMSQDELIQIAQLEQLVRTNLGSIRIVAGDVVGAFLTSMRVDAAQRLLDMIVEQADEVRVAPDQWHEAATERVQALRGVGDDMERSLVMAGEGLHASASRTRLLWSTGLVVLTGVSVLAGAAAVAAARQRAMALREYGELAAGLHRWFEVVELEDEAGVRVAARYDAVSEYARAGGDWYDAYSVGGGRVVFTVGDVAGHGATAIAYMAMVRNLLRGIALTSAGPPSVHLQTLDTAIRGSSTMATVFHAVLDIESGGLVYARAGHPAGLLRQGSTVTRLDGGLGSPVGVGSNTGYVDDRVKLDAGCQVVVFTDGLVEVRGGDVEAAIDQLGAELALAPEGVDEVADHLVGSRTLRADDTAVLVIAWQPSVVVDGGTFEEGANLVEGLGQEPGDVDL